MIIKETLFLISVLLLFKILFIAGNVHAQEVTIKDARHYSHILGETRNYRIFLPPGYQENPNKKYPVIYFFHGWSQRYFGSVSGNDYAEYDKGDDNDGDNIANFVAAHEVIVVKADGYNRNPDEEYYKRPWNVSPVETYRQFPIYFPELVDHIDAKYQTIADRQHRAISGLSMGGFMSFWIGGKYPHLLSAAGSFCGSPEFMVGPKNFPVEYRHMDMYNNYGGMNVRLNYGNEDFIRAYHRDLNNIWLPVMENYEYEIYDAAHSTAGLGEMFDFFMETFEDPPEKPEKWGHIDVYPEFSVWGYDITTDRILPGFTVLENVNEQGFRSSVRKHVPDGELLPFVNVTVTTPPIYENNQLYIINDLNLSNKQNSLDTIQSDQKGRLRINLDGAEHAIGINQLVDQPNITMSSFEVGNMDWARTHHNVDITLQLLNKGLTLAEGVTARLQAQNNNTEIINSKVEFGNIGVNNMQEGRVPFTFHVDDSIAIEKFKLVIQDNNGNGWSEEFEIPLRAEVSEFEDIAIADGKTFRVAKGGTDTATVFLGNGNGDGEANPGESIVALVKDQNIYRRAKLFSSDPYVNPHGLNIRKSDNWSAYDHVGGSAKYSAPVIASSCPEGRALDFYGEYWVADPPRNHIIKKGKISIKVTGKDNTPPVLRWVKIPGNNVIRAKFYDGAKIDRVRAKVYLQEDPEQSFTITLTDNGTGKDRYAEDNVFTRKIPEQKFGFYKVVIEAEDVRGNQMKEDYPEEFILH